MQMEVRVGGSLMQPDVRNEELNSSDHDTTQRQSLNKCMPSLIQVDERSPSSSSKQRSKSLSETSQLSLEQPQNQACGGTLPSRSSNSCSSSSSSCRSETSRHSWDQQQAASAQKNHLTTMLAKKPPHNNNEQ